uniref:Uncharacterized protein n=1 Tax=Onchocerca volvulus TaxID=6282 RepID=A0A8R1XZ13_ONCVO
AISSISFITSNLYVLRDVSIKCKKEVPETLPISNDPFKCDLKKESSSSIVLDTKINVVTEIPQL